VPKIICTAQVEDPVKWEQGFRTHADLFRSQTIAKPIHFTTDGNLAVICFEAEDAEAFVNGLSSPATAEAMAFDGVKRETAKFYILDKEMQL
jgi:hypothetical protein